MLFVKKLINLPDFRIFSMLPKSYDIDSIVTIMTAKDFIWSTIVGRINDEKTN